MNRPPDPMEPLPWTELASRPAEIAEIIARLDAMARTDPEVRYPSASLSDAAREICRVARASGLQVEQALVAVKTAWRSTPGRAVRRAGTTDEVLDQLITFCIREYYDPRAD